MGKGYAEGPAAEEAERRRAELEAGLDEGAAATRLAVLGSTADDPERHFLGWADEVDADALFTTGDAWGIRLERIPV